MEKAIFLCILIFCLSSLASAQTRTKNELLQNTAGNQVTLGAPATVTNNTILLPGTLGLQGGLLYIGSVAGAVGSTTWLNPGTNGQVLTLSSGVPIWSTPTSAQTNFADNVFSIFNSTTNTKIAVFNAASISAATTRTFTFPDVNGTLITTGNLSSITTTGTVTSGIWNGTAIGPTFGGTGLATYILGDMLYANGANLLSKLSAIHRQ
jgi:hypothetical protein